MRPQKLSTRLFAGTALLLTLACTCNSLTAIVPATATPFPTATSAPTKTPIPSSTPIPTDTPVPPPTNTPAPQPGDMLLHDIFADNANNWITFADAESDGNVANGSYVMNILTSGKVFWVTTDPPIVTAPNVDMSVEVTLVNGRNSNVSMGALCRYKDDRNFYLFQISGDGFYSVERMVGGNRSTLVDWTRSNAIITGKQTNVMQIVCSGKSLVFSVNDSVLAALEDAGNTEGGIALAAGTFGQPNATVSFDNLTVKVADDVGLLAVATNTPIPSTGGRVETPGITITNSVSFGVRVVVWGPASLQIDVSPGQTVLLPAPSGTYGWQAFANGCQLTPTNNLEVNPGVQVFITPDSGQCGYAVSSK